MFSRAIVFWIVWMLKQDCRYVKAVWLELGRAWTHSTPDCNERETHLESTTPSPILKLTFKRKKREGIATFRKWEIEYLIDNQQGFIHWKWVGELVSRYGQLSCLSGTFITDPIVEVAAIASVNVAVFLFRFITAPEESQGNSDFS